VRALRRREIIAGGPDVIHVCVRRTLDWQNEDLVAAEVFPEFRPKLVAWNATFDMPYHVFRNRLKTIAQLNLARIEGVALSELEAVPRGHVIVPVDDDDWLAPDLGVQLRRAHDPEVYGYLWRREVIEARPLLRRGLSTVARWLGRSEITCKTNNYAVVNEPGVAPLVLSQEKANEYFDAHLSGIRRIPATLAVQNRSLASQTALAWRRPSIGRDELVAVFRRYRNLYSSPRLAAMPSWARPYIALMAELMREIRPK
jgi:hypothetical protein